MRRVWVTLVVGLLAACEVSQEQAQRDVCTAACECTVNGLPSAVVECVDDCVAIIPPVSDECLECVYTYSQTCSELFDECEPICDPPQPQPRSEETR